VEQARKTAEGPRKRKHGCAGFSFAMDSSGEGPGYDEATSSEFRCRCNA
jgi:hypothetical protein